MNAVQRTPVPPMNEPTADGFDLALRLYNIIFAQEHTRMEKRVRERLAGELDERGLGHLAGTVLATISGDDSAQLPEEEKVRLACRRVGA